MNVSNLFDLYLFEIKDVLPIIELDSPMLLRRSFLSVMRLPLPKKDREALGLCRLTLCKLRCQSADFGLQIIIGVSLQGMEMRDKL